ncbi:MAG TPA: class I SAM-dependent methyltransferase [Caulobacteraceae bacterium]
MDGEADNIIGLYRRRARAWDAARSEHLREGAWLGRFLDLAQPEGAVLDLGCGGGQPIARHLIEQGRQVTGVDSSPEMIALCRERFPEQTWVIADMRGLDLGRRFAGILAWHSLFHLTPQDQEAMFAVFAAHAAPGAALMFTSGWNRGVAMGEFQGERLYHASLDPDEYHALLRTHGFKTVAHKVDQYQAGAAVVWLAQRV